ncbi:MAG: hypothetical protein ONB23_00785 [candidate division KSB1 bacterium]|nr:hypothetical protein [candidate division KSB1 bacterium]
MKQASFSLQVSAPELAREMVLTVVLLLLPGGVALSQWGRSPLWGGEEARLRLSVAAGAYRISHNAFEDYYRSRWGLVPGFLLRYRVKGIGFLAGVRPFRQRLASRLEAQYPALAGSSAWRQTVWNLGVQLGGGGMRRVRSATYFGLSYHVVREKAGPFLMDKSRSTTLGFFLAAETEWLILPPLGLGWMVELSSAAPSRSAAFEANSIGGLYLAALLHLHLF